MPRSEIEDEEQNTRADQEGPDNQESDIGPVSQEQKDETGTENEGEDRPEAVNAARVPVALQQEDQTGKDEKDRKDAGWIRVL